MKPIKIDHKNADKIEAALKAVNGKSTAHTFTTFGFVSMHAIDAKYRLETIGLAKKYQRHARVVCASGHPLPSAYKYPRAATELVFVFGATGVFLESVRSVAIYADGGKTTVTLTAEQDAQAVATLRKRYTIAATAV
jgi:hypothetical protein